MKKNLVLAVVIGVLIYVNAFAVDDDHLQDIKNWKQFYTKGGNTLSYQYQDGFPLFPEMYRIKKDIGYLYFYIKLNTTQEIRDQFQKELEKKYPREFKNIKFGYTITWCKIDCKNDTIQTIQEYAYSDTNKFIITYYTSEKPKPLAGSFYEKIPFNNDWIEQAKQEGELNETLKKYGAESLVPIHMLEVNPYEFEGHTIAVVVQFKKMLSKNSASFYSGYTDLQESTSVYDEIIITGIPKGTHFDSGIFSPRMMLALKGRGTIEGTNAFGARIKAPYFQWIAIISGKQPSVFEEQRDVSRKNALQNMRNARPSSAQ